MVYIAARHLMCSNRPSSSRDRTRSMIASCGQGEVKRMLARARVRLRTLLNMNPSLQKDKGHSKAWGQVCALDKAGQRNAECQMEHQVAIECARACTCALQEHVVHWLRATATLSRTCSSCSQNSANATKTLKPKSQNTRPKPPNHTTNNPKPRAATHKRLPPAFGPPSI